MAFNDPILVSHCAFPGAVSTKHSNSGTLPSPAAIWNRIKKVNHKLKERYTKSLLYRSIVLSFYHSIILPFKIKISIYRCAVLIIYLSTDLLFSLSI